jgi:hypothetical protein
MGPSPRGVEPPQFSFCADLEINQGIQPDRNTLRTRMAPAPGGNGVVEPGPIAVPSGKGIGKTWQLAMRSNPSTGRLSWRPLSLALHFPAAPTIGFHTGRRHRWRSAWGVGKRNAESTMETLCTTSAAELSASPRSPRTASIPGPNARMARS